MKLLLDTHIWLWSLLQPARLSAAVIEVLRDSETELFLSPVSIWEVTVLVAKGRVVLTSDVVEWVSEALSQVPVQEIPLTIEAALETNRLSLPHRDPADQFIVATARVFNLTLVTADRRIIGAKPCDLLPN